jgi:hypothetical protein
MRRSTPFESEAVAPIEQIVRELRTAIDNPWRKRN